MITDLGTRKAFDLANILKHQEIDILLCDAVEGISRLVLERAYGVPIEPLRKTDRFDEDLHAILRKYHNEKIVYIPIEEDTTLLFYRFLERGEVPENLFYNLPLKESFETVRDKGRFSAFCHAKGVPVPAEYHYEALKEMVPLPDDLIIKPRYGSGSAGIRFVDRGDSVPEMTDAEAETYLFQQRLGNPQNVEGGFFLFEKGKMVGYYGHRRMRTYPERGGVTVFSKCEESPELRELGKKVLEELSWSGIAMVEFLYDSKTGRYRIIEINPRLWGSLMLAEFCGSRILENYVLSALGEVCEPGTVDTSCYIRWFFPWDLLLYLQKWGRVRSFWGNGGKKVCYINFTYSRFDRSMLFTLYNMCNPKMIRKLLQKVRGA